MNKGCIYNIDLTTNSNDIISISSDNFNHFYIANIDDNGDEISYTKSDTNILYANFFMVRIINDINSDIYPQINRLLKQKDIVKIKVCFTNGLYQEFDIAKKRVAKDGMLQNIYEDSFMYEDDLCILITDKKIRYKENLFA